MSLGLLLLCFIFLLWRSYLSAEDEYKLGGEKLLSTRQELLSRWEIAKGSSSNRRLLFLSRNNEWLLATFTFERLYSLEGSTLSCSNGSIRVGDSFDVVHSRLGTPEQTRKLNESRTEEVYLHKGFLKVPLVCIVVTYKDGLVEVVTLVSVFRTVPLFLQTLVE